MESDGGEARATESSSVYLGRICSLIGVLAVLCLVAYVAYYQGQAEMEIKKNMEIKELEVEWSFRMERSDDNCEQKIRRLRSKSASPTPTASQSDSSIEWVRGRQSEAAENRMRDKSAGAASTLNTEAHWMEPFGKCFSE